MTWQCNKEDYLTLNEIEDIVREGTDPRLWVFQRIAEVIVNPMDIDTIEDVYDDNKKIPYSPENLDRAKPIYFLDEYHFSFLTEYPDSSTPVSTRRFLRENPKLD